MSARTDPIRNVTSAAPVGAEDLPDSAEASGRPHPVNAAPAVMASVDRSVRRDSAVSVIEPPPLPYATITDGGFMSQKSDKPLREHVLNLLKGGSAHVDFEKAIKDFPAELRGKKPKGAEHSPWEILEH